MTPEFVGTDDTVSPFECEMIHLVRQQGDKTVAECIQLRFPIKAFLMYPALSRLSSSYTLLIFTG